MIQSVECKSCGNIYYDDTEKCPYCGSVNPSYKKNTSKTQQATNAIKSTYEEIVSQTTSSTRDNNTSNSSSSSDLNVCLLIALLVIFWPAGLVYLIVKLANK